MSLKSVKLSQLNLKFEDILRHPALQDPKLLWNPAVLAASSLLVPTFWVYWSYRSGTREMAQRSFGCWLQDQAYIWKTRWEAIQALLKITPETESYKNFWNSYLLFDGDWTTQNGKTQEMLSHYYSVINYLCALGNVEKMYIPPLMEKGASNYRQQILCEEKMIRDMEAGPGKKVLDLGCGRGCIGMHISTKSGCHLTGINIDEEQIRLAKEFTQRRGLQDQTRWIVGNFNDPLPFEDEEFDCAYDVQAFTYNNDKYHLFREIYRVLKPGAKCTFLEWVILPGFDKNNSEHVNIIKQVKPLIGAIDDPPVQHYIDAAKAAGFDILLSEDMSIGGHQSTVIDQERRHYLWVHKLTNFLVAWKILPKYFNDMMERLNRGVMCFIQSDEMGLATASWQYTIQKPLKFRMEDML